MKVEGCRLAVEESRPRRGDQTRASLFSTHFRAIVGNRLFTDVDHGLGPARCAVARQERKDRDLDSPHPVPARQQDRSVRYQTLATEAVDGPAKVIELDGKAPESKASATSEKVETSETS